MERPIPCYQNIEGPGPTLHDAEGFILAVIDEDLYVPELNYVFGEADAVAGIAAIALPRLRRESYGLDLDSALFLLRATKEAIHEFGHSCGLGHCPDPKCVMHFFEQPHGHGQEGAGTLQFVPPAVRGPVQVVKDGLLGQRGRQR
ncbi:MAG TPA: hypothetical protein VL122_02560 [Nitrospirota bacterium]|nr:hypothetical protein [Nitrospirota bacterium]